MHCSVVFGVTLRLLVTNISLSSPAIKLSTPPLTTSDKCGTVVRRRRIDNTCPVAALTARSKVRYRLRSRFLPTPPAFDAPAGGGGFSWEYCYARMAWLHDGEKNSKTSLFVLTECTNVTDTHTHTPHDGIYSRACITSRGKNYHAIRDTKSTNNNLFVSQLKLTSTSIKSIF